MNQQPEPESAAVDLLVKGRDEGDASLSVLLRNMATKLFEVLWPNSHIPTARSRVPWCLKVACFSATITT